MPDNIASRVSRITQEAREAARARLRRGFIALRDQRMSRESPDRETDVRLFGPFRLDIGEERLWRGELELKLRRKPFAILRFLTENPRRLASQDEVVAAVWGKTATSESLLRTRMSELRCLLGEGVIETVAGRGYRFLLQVEKLPSPQTVDPLATNGGLAGRSEEMSSLERVFAAAVRHQRQMVFITGEPGIGKTALIDVFLSRIAVPQSALIVAGSCSERFGKNEAYFPVLAALGAAGRAPDGERVVELLMKYAPLWLAQMQGLVTDERLPALRSRIEGATHGRMLRELAEALDVIAADRPLVLVLEDMQWSDQSTTELIAMLGARREPARLLVVVTCRQTELRKSDGLVKIIAELTARKRALLLQLDTLTENAINEYLAQRFAKPCFPKELPSVIRELTTGNPRYAIALVDDLASHGLIRRVDGAWQLEATLAQVANRRPETVRQLIDIQIDRLSSKEQRILEAASWLGLPFTANTVGCALTAPADEVEEVCERLACQRRFLRFISTESAPDGTTPSRYDFVHALYRDAALARTSAATRRIWQQRLVASAGTAAGIHGTGGGLATVDSGDAFALTR